MRFDNITALAAELVQANLAAVETLGLLHLGSAQHASIEIVAPEMVGAEDDALIPLIGQAAAFGHQVHATMAADGGDPFATHLYLSISDAQELERTLARLAGPGHA